MNLDYSHQDIEALEWVVTEEARIHLQRARHQLENGTQLNSVIADLRKNINRFQASQVVTQIQLRDRAGKKFQESDKLFFTDKGVQQSTSELVAKYKALRFQRAPAIADLCCGIGGDLVQLGHVAPTTGVDINREAVICAKANCEISNSKVEVVNRSMNEVEFSDSTWIHIDPDRRPRGLRATQVEYIQPGIDELDQLISRHQNVAIKLAPATRVPDHWLSNCHREWIGENRETKQQVCWFGELHSSHGTRSATVVSHSGYDRFEIETPGRLNELPEFAESVDAYLFDLHSTLFAAHLTNAFAIRFGLKRMHRESSYFTAPDCEVSELAQSDLVSCFKVIDYTSVDLKKIKAMLRKHQITLSEVKKRSAAEDTYRHLLDLKPFGTIPGVVLLGRLKEKQIAIVAQRV